MEFGPDDLVMYGIYYLPSLITAIVTSLALLVTFFFTKRVGLKSQRLRILHGLLVPLPLICWVAYFVFTSDRVATLTLLDSESDHVAEKTYETKFKSSINTLNSAIDLAIGKRQPPNVRFYASCRIADLLVNSNEATTQGVLKQVEHASIIETQFFGGNRLTQDFYVPGHVQARVSVREIVRSLFARSQ